MISLTTVFRTQITFYLHNLPLYHMTNLLEPAEERFVLPKGHQWTDFPLHQEQDNAVVRSFFQRSSHAFLCKPG